MKFKKWVSIFIAVLLPLISAISLTVPAQALAGTISLSPSTGAVYSSVTVTGSGFTINHAYSLYWDTTTLLASGTTNGTGGFTNTISIPVAAYGNHSISVTSTGDTSTPQVLTVTPNLLSSSYSTNVGTTLTVYGTGYTASTSVAVKFDGVTYVSATTNTLGSFSASFTIPQTTAGSHLVVATDSLTRSSTLNVSVAPKITLGSASGSVGSSALITGTGFTGNNTITFTLGSSTLGTVASNSTGSFNYTMTVPSVTAGSYVVKAVDTYANNATSTFTVAAALIVNPASSVNGGTVAVTGSGFVPNAAVNILIDNSSATSVNADSNGNIAIAAFSFPPLTGGSHIIKAIDSSSNTATATLKITPAITLTPNSGQSGTTVQVRGNGFIASSAVTLSVDGTRLTTSPSVFGADSSGNIIVSFAIPSLSGGTHTITANDGTSSATAAFSVTSNVSTGQSTGKVGSTGTVSGTGFGARATVAVKFDSVTLSSAVADANGNVTINFSVPAAASGIHTIVITDGTRSNNFTYTVQPAVTINPASGNVGTTITVTGTGFGASSSINISYDGSKITTTPIQADSNGNFSAVFSAPASKGGIRVISVTDVSNTLTTNFAMDSTAPSAPQNLTPTNDTKAPSLAAFTWSTVNDPSGVTYEFQLSSSSDFSTPLISATNLSGAGYTITQVNKLKSASRNHPYYWRVRAIDGADNVSGWSTPTTFFVGFTMPVVGWVLIAIVLIALSGVSGFFLGRRAIKPAAKPIMAQDKEAQNKS
jgi:hypothetical protein